MNTETVDAVVVGGGHHGLVAATMLADAGWDVLLLEARDKVGGAVSSVVDGPWVMDEFSACHPLAKSSPALLRLGLEDFGLRWADAPRPVAHVANGDDPLGAAIETTPPDTAAGLQNPRDGETWLTLANHYARVKGPLLDALLTQWPPTTSAARLARAVGASDLLDFARFALLPLDRMVTELFVGQDARDLFAGNAMHADIPPTAPGSGMFGWLMSMLAQDAGFSSPAGGTRMLATALERRAVHAGVDIRVHTPVAQILVRGGRTTGVVTADGRSITARRAVVADTSAPALYERLLPDDAVPPGLRARLDRFVWDLPTVKVNYKLSTPMPWSARRAHGAGVVHVGHSSPGLTRWSTDLETGRVPDRAFSLVGQMSTIDPSRSPAGTEALWLYTHAPRGMATAEVADRVAENAEKVFDELAPGWRDSILQRWVQRPDDLHQADDNLAHGAVAGGTMQLFQQAIWRPVTGLGGPATHLDGLYHASAAVHPGGGVHGAAGFMAARAALRQQRWWGKPTRSARLRVLGRLYDSPPSIG
jgi:phytoene dehydrogenase-like protein